VVPVTGVVRQELVDVVSQRTNALMTALGATQGQDVARAGIQSGHEHSAETVILARLETGRLSRRLTHVFEVTPDCQSGATLTARCGETLPVSDLTWLPALAGLPCNDCLGCPEAQAQILPPRAPASIQWV
jgi:hypothetical protein